MLAAIKVDEFINATFKQLDQWPAKTAPIISHASSDQLNIASLLLNYIQPRNTFNNQIINGHYQQQKQINSTIN